MNSATRQGQVKEPPKVPGKEWPKNQGDNFLSLLRGLQSYSAASPHHHIIPCKI